MITFYIKITYNEKFAEINSNNISCLFKVQVPPRQKLCQIITFHLFSHYPLSKQSHCCLGNAPELILKVHGHIHSAEAYIVILCRAREQKSQDTKPLQAQCLTYCNIDSKIFTSPQPVVNQPYFSIIHTFTFLEIIILVICNKMWPCIWF